MTIIFSAREIVEAAVEKEKIRRDFYQKVAELATDEKMKALFLFLKEEEDRHVSEFTKIRDNTPKDSSRPEEYMDEMEAYMDSVIDDQLYSKINSDEFVGNAISEGKVLQMAIGFEKDAILYFTEFLSFLAAEDRNLVELLIEEEKGHIRKLAAVKQQMG